MTHRQIVEQDLALVEVALARLYPHIDRLETERQQLREQLAQLRDSDEEEATL